MMTFKGVVAAESGTWTLGDLTVNRIGFGAMRLTANADGTPSDRDRAVAVLRRAVELGVNHIDTAAFYDSDAILTVARGHGATPAQVRIAWTPLPLCPIAASRSSWLDRPR
jgi:aryl-alcohol dehydrogenase-like predicted oxidoreductase